MVFGECAPITELTLGEICEGIQLCGGEGLRVSPSSMNAIFSFLFRKATIDVDDLAGQLCANETFRACVISLATPSTHSVVSTAVNPGDSGEGATFCYTITLDAPVTIAAVRFPVYLSGAEQDAHGYAIPGFITIQPGETTGTLCVETVNDDADEPDAALTLVIGTTPRVPGFLGGELTALVRDDDEPPVDPPTVTGAPFMYQYAFGGTSAVGSYGPSVTYSVFSGDLPMTISSPDAPAGLTITDNGDGSVTIEGAPQAYGDYPFTLVATNAGGSATFTGAAAHGTQLMQFIFRGPGGGLCPSTDTTGGCGLYAFELRPNGDVYEVGNVAGSGIVWNRWAAYIGDPSMFEAMFTESTKNPAGAGVWHNLGSVVRCELTQCTNGFFRPNGTIQIRAVGTTTVLYSIRLAQIRVAKNTSCLP